MDNELYIHTWSSGDVSIYCYKCGDVLEDNFSSGYADYRTYSSLVRGIHKLAGKTKFVGCITCRRGAEVKLVKMSIYRMDFNPPYNVDIFYADKYLGGSPNVRKQSLNWRWYGKQEYYQHNG